MFISSAALHDIGDSKMAVWWLQQVLFQLGSLDFLKYVSAYNMQ